MSKELMKLIEDYGHAMYNCGENTDPDDKYYSRQVGKTHKRIREYFKKEKKNETDPE